MVLLESTDTPLGAAAPDFSLRGTDGTTYSLASFESADVLVVMFICNHCPYVVAIEDRLVALGRDYKDRGVALVGIMSNDVDRYPADHPDRMRERVQDKGYTFPYLYDGSQAAAKAYGAVCTPDLFVYDRDRRLAYHGRLDDNWREPASVKKRDLRDALDLLLDGKKPATDQLPAMGCSIKWID